MHPTFPGPPCLVWAHHLWLASALTHEEGLVEGAATGRAAGQTAFRRAPVSSTTFRPWVLALVLAALSSALSPPDLVSYSCRSLALLVTALSPLATSSTCSCRPAAPAALHRPLECRASRPELLLCCPLLAASRPWPERAGGTGFRLPGSPWAWAGGQGPEAAGARGLPLSHPDRLPDSLLLRHWLMPSPLVAWRLLAEGRTHRIGRPRGPLALTLPTE